MGKDLALVPHRGLTLVGLRGIMRRLNSSVFRELTGVFRCPMSFKQYTTEKEGVKSGGGEGG